MTVHEMMLNVDDVDEIFSTGNLSQVAPVIRFEDRELPFGPMARKARGLYWDWGHSAAG